MTMSGIFRWLMENSRTAARFQSFVATIFATFRWTKTSPGRVEVMLLTGTLESEQLIQRTVGLWAFVRDEKNSFSLSKVSATKRRFPSSSAEIIGHLRDGKSESEAPILSGTGPRAPPAGRGPVPRAS